MGAKSGQKKKPPAGKAAGSKRLALIVFGAIFVLLVAGFAIAQGIGETSVPAGDVAIVKSVPDDISNVGEAEFKAAVVQQLAAAQIKKPPKPGSKKDEEVREAALSELLDAIWIQGEAEELNISVTDKEVETELAQIKKTNFPTATAYKEFLETSKLTQEDVDRRLRVQLLGTKIQEVVSSTSPPPSNDEIAANYEENKATQFTVKPSRDVRVIINEDKAKAEAAKAKLEADNSPASWKKVAPKYSSDPSTNAKGGLQPGLTEEILQTAGPLKKAIFGATVGEVLGPVEFQKNYVVFEVVKLHGEKVQQLGEVRAQISSQLGEANKQKFFQEFVTEYQTKWTSRTFCASEFLSGFTRCANYKGTGHPTEAQPACYEADPKVPPKECPAPVIQTKPALPGSVTRLKPSGVQLAQRPRPAGLKEGGGKVGAALPEGVSPATGE